MRRQTDQLMDKAGVAGADVRCTAHRDRPVCETHTILLDIQCCEFFVVPQSLLLLASDSQVKTKHGIRLQFYRLASIQS